MALKEYKPGTGSGVSDGRAPRSPITSPYGPPFEFTGTILSVTADILGNCFTTRRRRRKRSRVAMARQ